MKKLQPIQAKNSNSLLDFFYKISLLFTILISLIFSSCENKTESVPEKIKWERHPMLVSEVGIMNSIKANKKVNVLLPNTFFKNISLSLNDAETEQFSMGPYEKAGRLKFPRSQNYFLYTNFN